jgi:hypothetical protein
VHTHSIVSLLTHGGSFSKEEDKNIFQNPARVVTILLQFQMEPREPIFEKCSHLREKSGGAEDFSRFVWWVVWAESPIQILKFIW